MKAGERVSVLEGLVMHEAVEWCEGVPAVDVQGRVVGLMTTEKLPSRGRAPACKCGEARCCEDAARHGLGCHVWLQLAATTGRERSGLEMSGTGQMAFKGPVHLMVFIIDDSI